MLAVLPVIAAVASVGALGCSSDDSGETRPTTSSTGPGETTTTAPPVIDATLRLGKTSVVGIGVPARTPPEIKRAVSRAVVATLDAYVDAAFLAPLRGEKIVLDDLVGPRAAARLARRQHDRGVMTNDGLPEVRGATVRLAPTNLTALSEGFAGLSLVSGTLDLETDLTTIDGDLSVHHFGEIVLARDGEEWRVIGYEMIVVRDDGTAVTTTTATAAP
jgi:hypothetical protein